MKAWTNIKLMSLVTVGLFVYAFLQPIFFPTSLSNALHINPFALIFGFVALYMDIKQYQRIKGHYKHLEFNTTDPKCKDCIERQNLRDEKQ